MAVTATKIAVIATVKAPLSDLKIFINYYLDLGIDRILLFFDDPDDPGIKYFSVFSRVDVHVCDADYWFQGCGRRPKAHQHRQTFNINRGAQLVKAMGYQWVIPLDNDELLFAKSSLRRLLDNTRADAVRFPIMEALSEKLEYKNIFEPNLFKKLPNRVQRQMAKRLGCRTAMFHGEYFRGHMASKMAVRLSEKIVQHGIHAPDKTDGQLIVEQSHEVILLHFDCVGFANWQDKWGMRLRAYGTTPSPHHRPARQKQFQLFCEAQKGGKGKMKELYQQLHTVPKREKTILYLLGLLTRVDLDKTFKEPSLRDHLE